MQIFFRAFQHLLPDAQAWRVAREGETAWFIGEGHTIGELDLVIVGGGGEGRPIERLFWGLAGTFHLARRFIDAVYLDRFADTTRELAEYEYQFGLLPAALESDRRLNIDAAWKATGGQDPHYLQAAVQAAGFDLFIHEWWASGPPYVARDPRDYTTQPLIGQVQCGDEGAECGELEAMCNNFLANDPGYLVNPLLGQPPPPVPNDPAFWPYFLYWGGETFPSVANVPASRRHELEALLMRLCPTEQWIVLLVNFVDADS